MGLLAKSQLIMMAIALMFIVVFLLSHIEGFRKRRYTWLADQAAMNSVEAIASFILI
ncbi:MAG: DUF2391 family protein [Nostoc sp.]|uniref:DUF2391 family protein n=1 Tax=Nostoc sp. TaxID=1180 RepID=UPI002FF74151